MRSVTCRKPRAYSFGELIHSLADNKERSVLSRPKANILKTNDGFVIELTAIGFSKDEISLSVEDRTLTIAGKKAESDTEQITTYRRKEFGINDWKRAFTLSRAINTESIKAELNQGVLSVYLSKKEELAKRDISID